MQLSASASASSCAPPFVGCCVASLGPSLLLRPSIVMFYSSFLPLEFPLIVVISLLLSIVRCPSPPPSFSSLSRAAIFDCCVIVVCRPSYRLHCRHHVARCHHCLLLSPPLLLAGSHRPLPDAVFVLFVRCSHCRRSVVGKQANNRPCPQAPPRLWVDIGRRGTWAKVSHALFDC